MFADRIELVRIVRMEFAMLLGMNNRRTPIDVANGAQIFHYSFFLSFYFDKFEIFFHLLDRLRQMARMDHHKRLMLMHQKSSANILKHQLEIKKKKRLKLMIE